MVEFLETLQSLDADAQFMVVLLSILGLILINMFFSMVKSFFVEFFKIFRKVEKCNCTKNKNKDNDKAKVDIKI